MHKTLGKSAKKAPVYRFQEQKTKLQLLLNSRNLTPAQLAKALFPRGRPTPPSVYRWCRGETEPSTRNRDHLLSFFAISLELWDSPLNHFRANIPRGVVSPLTSLVEVLNQQQLIAQDPVTVAAEFQLLEGQFVAIRHSFNPSKGMIVSTFEIASNGAAAVFRHAEVTARYEGALMTSQGGIYAFIGADVEDCNPVTYLFDMGNKGQSAIEFMAGIQTGISKDFQRSVAAANIVLLRRDAPSWKHEITQLENAQGLTSARTSLPKFIAFNDIPARLQGLLSMPSPSLLLPLRHPSRLSHDSPG